MLDKFEILLNVGSWGEENIEGKIHIHTYGENI